MALREAGLDVVQVSRKPREQKNGTVLVGDLGDSNFVDSCVDGADVIVHCAGRTGAGGHELFDVNRDMAFSLARAARKHGVRHFIHVSSTGVFGVCSAALVQGEDSPCDPANDYERSKFEGERAVLGEADRAMFVTVVRPSNVFGEHHPWQKLLTWFASVQRGRILLAGDLESQWVNYVYVGDVSRSIAELARRGPAADANSDRYIINTPTTLREFVQASAMAVGVECTPWVAPKFPLLTAAAACDVVGIIRGRPLPLTRGKVHEILNRRVFSVDKLQRSIPEFPFIGIQRGLQRTATWYRSLGLL